MRNDLYIFITKGRFRKLNMKSDHRTFRRPVYKIICFLKCTEFDNRRIIQMFFHVHEKIFIYLKRK